MLISFYKDAMAQRPAPSTSSCDAIWPLGQEAAAPVVSNLAGTSAMRSSARGSEGIVLTLVRTSKPDGTHLDEPSRAESAILPYLELSSVILAALSL